MAQLICAYSECNEPVEVSVHNKIYHSDECCKLATNARIMEKYYETKARKGGAVRICRTPGCSTRLSRYNPEKVCAKCENEMKQAQRERMLKLLDDVL